MSERFDLLVARLLDDALDPAGRDELAALLAAEPGLQARYVQQLQQHAALRAALAGSGMTESARVEVERLRPLARIPARRRIVRRSRRRTTLLPMVLTLGGLLLVAGIAWWSSSSSSSPPAPAVVLAAGRIGQLADGAALAPGRGYRAADAGAELACDDGSRLHLAADGELVFERPGPPQRVFLLRRGRLVVAAAPQPSGRVLAVRTPELRAEVVGTRFSVTHGEGGSEVVVEEGRVRVQVRGFEGRWIQLAAGERFHSRSRSRLGSGADLADPRWEVHGDLPWSGPAPRAAFGLPPGESEDWHGRALLWTEPVAVATGFELRARVRIPEGIAGRWHVELAAVAAAELDREAQARRMLRLDADEAKVELLLLRDWYRDHLVIHRGEALAPGLHQLVLRLAGERVLATIDGVVVHDGPVAHGYAEVRPALRVARKGASAGELEIDQVELHLGP